LSNSIVHFEIPADDVERAKKFYQEALGWKISDPWNMMYWLVETKEKGAEGINGGLMKRMGPPPADMQAVNAYVCTVGIPDLDARVAKALGLGGTMALPKMAVPGIGWLAYVKDTEGNIFGMIQNDPTAK